MKILSLVLAVMFLVTPLAIAGPHHHHGSSSEAYVEDPRLEAGIGFDLVHNFNDTNALRWENRWDVNNCDITGNIDDWTDRGISTYLVYQLTTDKLLERLFGKK